MLSVQNLSKSYYTNKDERIEAIKNVSFELLDGEVTTLLGANGAGKTTIIKSILGLVAFDSGNIIFNNYTITPRNQIKLLKESSCMIEGIKNYIPQLTPLENMEYWSILKNLDVKKTIESGKRMLDYFSLDSKKQVPIFELSRGMKQSVSVCLTLMENKSFIFLDEPTLGMDIQTVEKLIEYIKKITDTKQISILMSTHNLDFAYKVSNKILFLNRGRINKEVATNKITLDNLKTTLKEI